MNARAVVTDGAGQFQITNIGVGSPQEHEVLVEMKASGVCHTDWDSLNWGKRMIVGHEGAGVVLEVGSKVTRVSPEDSVVLNWAIPCSRCFQCRNGNESICERMFEDGSSGDFAGHAHPAGTTIAGEPVLRSFRIGTMSTHTLVREEAVVKFTADIPFSSACIIGCGVMTGYGSVVNAAKVSAGSSVVVLGCGGVGLNVIQGARIAEAGNIIAIDVNSSRLEMAKQFGATNSILANPDDTGLLQAAEEVKKRTDGRGADYAFECTAIPELAFAPLAMVRNAGTAVQVSGVEQTIDVDMNLFEWDKLYINPLYGKCRPQIDLPVLLKLYQNGSLLLDELVTQTYSLEELDKAFQHMHEGINAKGVLIIE